MKSRIVEVVVAALAVLFAIHLYLASAEYPFLDRASPAKWVGWHLRLSKLPQPVKFEGRLVHHYGGLDVYSAGDGKWWLLSSDGRLEACPGKSRDEVKAVADRMVIAIRKSIPLTEEEREWYKDSIFAE